MEKEKQIKGLKLKLMAVLASLIVCVLFVGVSVYAALSQTVTVNDSIQIKTSGQSLVAVKVESKKDYAGTIRSLLSANLPDDASSNLSYVTAATYITMLDVAAGQNGSLAYNSANAPVFSYTNGYTYYAYKITLTNESTDTGATYTIAQSFVGNDQIDVYYSDGTSFTKTAITGGSLSAAGGGSASATVYIIYAINTNMANLVPLSASPYALTINTASV